MTENKNNEIPEVFAHEARDFRLLKKIWMSFKNTKIYNKFRHSDLNPYHMGVRKIEAKTLDEARRIMRDDAKKAAAENRKIENQFIWNNTRYYADKHCSVAQEYSEDKIILRDRYNVTDRIPRDKNGNPDLLAETPILFSIIPVEGPALVGHASMQYEDIVVNRLLGSIHTDSLYQKYKNFSEYYYVYPSQLGINPKELRREMEKHNIRNGRKKYNLLFNNCARNVGKILQSVGVKDIDFIGIDKLGVVFTNPGNNPFNNGIQGWCRKHGVRVHPEEVAEYDKLFPISKEQNREQRKEYDAKRARYMKLRKRVGGRE